MARDIKTITVNSRCKFRILHIEAPGCIINIHHGLTNMDGDPVTSVSIFADRYADGKHWTVITPTGEFDGVQDLRSNAVNIRVVQDGGDE